MCGVEGEVGGGAGDTCRVEAHVHMAPALTWQCFVQNLEPQNPPGSSMRTQVEKVLMLEQRPAEFLMRAEEVGGASFTRATNACLLVCSVWAALHREAAEQLDGPNLASFLTEVNADADV